jgi:CHAD domain-containing protein/HD superfamily phosphodiesterase
VVRKQRAKLASLVQVPEKIHCEQVVPIAALAFCGISGENRVFQVPLFLEVSMPSSAPTTRPAKTTGLRYWMLRVLEECDRVSAGFEADPVHDLRVSIRRCRSLADGLMALDPDPDWKAMKKAGKRLFQRLGALRDIQIMMEWIEKLSPDLESSAAGERQAEFSTTAPLSNPNDGNDGNPAGFEKHHHQGHHSAAHALLHILRGREHEQKLEAQAALEQFDRKQWRHWSKSLPARAARFRPGSALFKHLALERWTAARELHNRALRNRSQTAYHGLRIGIKRFRYIVENFLPAEHKAWSNDLKEMQDLLGEVHDLDVLWATAISCHVFADAELRRRWHKRILAERTKRIDRYRARMIGPDSRWSVWRAALPQGKQIQSLAMRRMKLWANSLDPDFAHSERVASLALQLYDGLMAFGWKPSVDAASARSTLIAAALLHDVGKSEGQKGHHKASCDLIRAHGAPLGWQASDVERAAIVARFHCGALPTKKHKLLRDLLPNQQRAAIQLSAVLRLANAFDAAHDGHIRRIQVEDNREKHARMNFRVMQSKNGFKRSRDGSLIIAAEGYSPSGRSAQTIAAERHLLETVLHRAVLVRPLKTAP